MRRILYDREGEARLYLTGAGVLYTLENRLLGFVAKEQVVDCFGKARAFFAEDLLWDLDGKLLAFVKGAKAELELPTTKPLKAKPQPGKATFVPFLYRVQKPELSWTWSDKDVELVFATEA